MKDFLEEAKKQGFVIVQEEDITDRILPTLDYGTQVYRNFIKPVLNCILTTMEVHLKPIHWMFMQVLKLKIKGKSLRQIIINNVVPMDRKTFKDNLVYRIILFKKA
jgi:hypothetical protein